MSIKKVLVHKKSYKEVEYGVIDSLIPDTTYRVGDLVSWESKNSNNKGITTVGYNPDSEFKIPFLMGWASFDIREDNSSFKITSTILPARLVTKEIIEHYGYSMTIVEKEVKEVTLDEIRKYVPFEFELI